MRAVSEEMVTLLGEVGREEESWSCREWMVVEVGRERTKWPGWDGVETNGPSCK